jgi:hypothetical protein
MPVIDRDLGYADMMVRLAGMHSVSILVGIDDEDPELAEIALYNEFGTLDGHVPERSFLRSTMDEGRPKYLRLQEVAVDRMLDGLDPRLAYGAIGLVACADVRRRIRNRVDPPNAASTIAKKGSDTPLVDTGRLYDAIGYTVEHGE